MTLMVIVLATLDQNTVVIWVILTLAVVTAAAYYYFRGNAIESKIENSDLERLSDE